MISKSLISKRDLLFVRSIVPTPTVIGRFVIC